jgi:hypothetical protein
VRALDHVRRDLEVFVQELGRAGAVRANTPDDARRHEHELGPLAIEELKRLVLVGQVELVLGPTHEVRVPALAKLPPDRGADHAGVTGDVDLGLTILSHPASVSPTSPAPGRA